MSLFAVWSDRKNLEENDIFKIVIELVILL